MIKYPLNMKKLAKELIDVYFDFIKECKRCDHGYSSWKETFIQIWHDSIRPLKDIDESIPISDKIIISKFYHLLINIARPQYIIGREVSELGYLNTLSKSGMKILRNLHEEIVDSNAIHSL